MGELMIKNDGLALLTSEKALGDVIKPLVKEIHLFDTYIAGTTHLTDDSVLEQATEGMQLTLRREDNKFDSKAILLLLPDGRKIGYVPEKDNVIFSRLMDAGKLLTAKITSVKDRGHGFKQIAISIYLVDF